MGRSAALVEMTASLLATADAPDPGGALAYAPLALAVLYVSCFAHELGHALLGRMAGYVVTSFGLGTARPWCVVRIGGTRAYLSLVRPFQGIAFSCMPHREPSRREQAVSMAGGIVANELLALVGLGLWLAQGGVFWATVAWVNGVLGAASLIPIQCRVGKAMMQSDGWQLVRIWRLGSTAIPAPLTIQVLNAFRPLWTATGDTLALHVYLVGSAEAWACLGDVGRAEALLAEMESLACADVPGLAAVGSLVRAVVAIEAGRLAEAAADLDAAEAGYRRSATTGACSARPCSAPAPAGARAMPTGPGTTSKPWRRTLPWPAAPSGPPRWSPNGCSPRSPLPTWRP